MPIAKRLGREIGRILILAALLLPVLQGQAMSAVACTTTLYPDAAGDRTELNSYPYFNNYQSVQADDGDSSYVSSNNNDTYLVDLYNLDDATPSGSIDSVKITMVVRATNYPYQPSAYTVIKTGGTEYNGTAETVTKYYQSYTTTYTTNPATGLAWTWSDIDDLQVGVALRRGGNHRITKCTQVHVIVDCSSSPPTATTGAATLVEETTATLNGSVADDGGEACEYRFQYGTAPGVYSVNTTWTGSKTTGQSFDIALTSLSEGTKYYYRAQLKNSGGTGSGSELSLLTKPLPPTDFVATPDGGSQVNLTWTKGIGAQRTMVRRKEGDYPADINDGVEVYFDTGTSSADSGLTPETEYFYRAWSEVTGSQQWSDAYAAVATTTGTGGVPTTPPPTPTAVGGIVLPVDKTRILAPWLALGVLAVLAVAGTVLRRLKKV
jgi:hypothetical protein